MDHPSARLPTSSGIPRLSRLPIPRAPEKLPISEIDPAKTSHAVPGTVPQDVHNDRVFAQAAGKTRNRAFQAGNGLPAGPATPIEPAEIDTAGPQHTERTIPRRSRPSLSDRTIETLSQIPPSPSPRRRQSSFFTPESPAVASSRPTSSLSRSRPGTSHGQYQALPSGFPTSRPPSPTKRPLVPSTGNQIPNATPTKRAVSSYVPRSMPHPPTSAKLYSNINSTPSKFKSSVPSPSVIARKASDGVVTPSKPALRQVGGSKTLAARSSKQRPSTQDAFAGASPRRTGTSDGSYASGRPEAPPLSSAVLAKDALMSSNHSNKSGQTSSAKPESSRAEPFGNTQSPKSSAALRETIAKAKAARRVASQSSGSSGVEAKPGIENFPDFDVTGSNKDVLRKRIASARTDGRLNIAAQGLREMPKEVMDMYNTDSAGSGAGAWYEAVDLVRLIAADNEFENLQDEVFPDDVAGIHSMEDDYQGNLFGGLETLDLHGNRLRTLPLGLRRLERLTVLNLSKNSLGNACLDVISQIHGLRELRLAENALTGTLSHQLSEMTTLEVLNVQNNALSALPRNLDALLKLRVLQVAGNQLGSLPFECLANLPLLELDAARNRLSGSLFPSSIDKMPQLKSLDIANNALTSISAGGTIDLPALQFLNLRENRLTELPDISHWTNLLTLTAGGNKLSSFPEGMTSLQQLKSADFSMNNIKKMDERFGLMECLTVLRVANNPLRERKFLTMETDEMKRELRSRIVPAEPADALGNGHTNGEGLDPALGGSTEANMLWPVKPGGILDRSSTNLDAMELSDLEPLVPHNDIKTLVLHHNLLLRIPHAIVVVAHSLTNLDLSYNKLGSNGYLGNALSLPNLKSLDLSTNSITSLNPLLGFLSAPRLSELKVSRNRLTSLSVLRKNFPSLVSLFASDNKITELQVDAVKGLHVLDVSGNEIAQLEPKLGLLGSEGLRTFLVGGNTFRVPRRDVVDKGTGAVLAYLKSRIPDEEMEGLQ